VAEEDAGLTQRGLAVRLEVHQGRISDVERGESPSDIRVLRQYFHALGVTLADFAQMLEVALAEGTPSRTE